MKKLFAGLFSAALLTGTAVGLTSTTASAAPYPGSVNTVCHSWNVGHPSKGDDVRAYFSVAAAGNGIPHGRAIFHYVRHDGAFRYDFNRYFPGGEKVYNQGPMHPGRYTVVARFDSRPDDSVYQNCRTTFEMQVTRS